MSGSTTGADRGRDDRRPARTTRPLALHSRSLRRLAAGTVLLATPLLAVACNDDTSDPTNGTPDSSIQRNPNSTTTGVPQTSTSVPVPTSDAGATPGQGSQPEQPGGTAQPQDGGSMQTVPGSSGSGSGSSG